MSGTTGRLAGKRVMVTGAGGGLGGAIAERAVAEGASALVLADLAVETVAGRAEEIRGSGATALAVALDVADEESWIAALGRVGDEIGGVDVLVNNAGITHRAGILDTDLESWNRVIGVNQTGVFLGMKHVGALMAATGGGSIVNIGSFTSYTGYRAASYAASKWAVRGLTATAADELGPHGIRVNSVAPGFVATPLTANAPKLVESFAADSPLRRPCEPADIASAVAYLASDDAGYVTGQDLVVDGGVLANTIRHVRG